MPFCEALHQENLVLKEENKQLRGDNKKLMAQLTLNSGNSSIPSSKDGFKPPKVRSSREKSDKKPGGQPGHEGKGGKLKDNPDKIIPHTVDLCMECGLDLKDVPADEIVRKQIEDLPAVKTIVIEHRIDRKTCPCCQVRWEATGCPAHIRNEFQFGPYIQAIAVYLSAHQFIPAKRTKELFSVLGVELSTGTLDNFRRAASRELTGFMGELRQSIVSSKAAFFDETGMKVSKVRHWVHVACTSVLCLFLLHPKRGREAHEEMNVLPHFKGVLHRDDYRSYRTYGQATHSLCCAHILRDLRFVIDHDEHKEWADKLIHLLIEIKNEVEATKKLKLTSKQAKRHRKSYRALIAEGLHHNPPTVRSDGQTRGITAQPKTVNLLLRMQREEKSFLRFMTHRDARFDNNTAERDLRMNKVRQKISGGFRSRKAGEEFMRVRSFIATAVKQGCDPLEELTKLFTPGNESYMRLVRNPE